MIIHILLSMDLTSFNCVFRLPNIKLIKTLKDRDRKSFTSQPNSDLGLQNFGL